MKLTVLSRTYCHLCDDLVAALDAFRARAKVVLDVEVVDIDRFPALEAQWGDKVPVLLAGDREVCHYHFDETALVRALGESGALLR
ncbi:MAG TPA: glutaredoxin family protein [Usitatibacteraceae bacterium]|nr:glutaredoxin family protein [Usitatibacteraceae bacterium]